MRKFLLLAILTATIANNSTANQVGLKNYFSINDCDGINQDRLEEGFNYMMSELQRAHKALYALPYSYEYIKGTLLTDIELKKKEIAPHFPNRSEYGTDEEAGKSLFRAWYTSFPSEWRNYVAYVDKVVADNSK